MDAQQFLAEFGHIANAPNGIIKLRELVLQLAISGRLVEKEENFQPVQEVLEDANDLRVAYEKSLKLRSTRMQPPLTKPPYIIPEHWKWERLERLCTYIQRGKGPKYVDKSSTYVVSQKCIQWSGFDLALARYVADDSLEKYGKERFLCDGDLLWNSTGTGTAGPHRDLFNYRTKISSSGFARYGHPARKLRPPLFLVCDCFALDSVTYYAVAFRFTCFRYNPASGTKYHYS